MWELFRDAARSQLEAALCMLSECIEACPAEHWEGKVANHTFRQVAYHTLFFLDLYLSPSEEAFVLRELHERGGDERRIAGPCPSLSQEETLAYVAICRQKIADVLGSETRETLEGPPGFDWLEMSRAEAHLYNLRHVQHHTGQLSAFLRRVQTRPSDQRTLGWVDRGWK